MMFNGVHVTNAFRVYCNTKYDRLLCGNRCCNRGMQSMMLKGTAVRGVLTTDHMIY